MISALKFVMLNFWQAGALEVMRKIQRSNVNLALYGPSIANLADQATATFCNTVNSNISIELDKLRIKVLEESKDPIRDFSKNCIEMLSSPSRIQRIATTETVRAFNGGKIIAAKQANFKGKRWKISSNPCKMCVEMQARGTIPLDDPFTILNGGGSYSIVNFPPLHPSCECSIEFESGQTPHISRTPLQTSIRWLGYR